MYNRTQPAIIRTKAMPIYVQLSSKDWNVKAIGLCEVHAMRLGWQDLSPSTWIPILRGASHGNRKTPYNHGLEVCDFNFGVATPYDFGNGSVVGKRPHGSGVPGGQSGGQSSGSSMNPSNGVELQSFGFGVQPPLDPGGNSGKPGGKRPHNPIIIRWFPGDGIPVDVYQGKPFGILNLNFFTNPDAGNNYSPLRVVLTNATITDVRPVIDPGQHQSAKGLNEYIEIEIAFQKIEINGSLTTSTSDDWSTGTGSGKKKHK